MCDQRGEGDAQGLSTQPVIIYGIVAGIRQQSRPGNLLGGLVYQERKLRRVESIVHIDRRGQALHRAEGHRVGDGFGRPEGR